MRDNKIGTIEDRNFVDALTNEDNAPSRQDEDRATAAKLPRYRIAEVDITSLGAGGLRQVQAYLPTGYTAVELGNRIVILGHDYAGWTLDGYVLPRLASGMIYATEVK